MNRHCGATSKICNVEASSERVVKIGTTRRIHWLASERDVWLEMGDISFSEGTLNVTGSIVYGVVGPCKTEASQKPVPLHPLLAETLEKWMENQPYNKAEDWVFASRPSRGRKPCWGHMILRKYIQPTALKVGIQKKIGWHTFRHTYSTLLRSVGAEFKVMQELLRHATLRSTMDVYTQAVTPAKFAAQAAVVSLVFPGREKAS